MPLQDIKMCDQKMKDIYQISKNENRDFRIVVRQNEVIFDGMFSYIINSEVKKARRIYDCVPTVNFLGIGYRESRSNRKFCIFLMLAAIVELLHMFLKKVLILRMSASTFYSIMNFILYFVAGMCLVAGIIFFFSKTKVIEISFLNKSICVPCNSLTKQECEQLFNCIKSAQEQYKNEQKIHFENYEY